MAFRHPEKVDRQHHEQIQQVSTWPPWEGGRRGEIRILAGSYAVRSFNDGSCGRPVGNDGGDHESIKRLDKTSRPPPLFRVRPPDLHPVSLAEVIEDVLCLSRKSSRPAGSRGEEVDPVLSSIPGLRQMVKVFQPLSERPQAMPEGVDDRGLLPRSRSFRGSAGARQGGQGGRRLPSGTQGGWPRCWRSFAPFHHPDQAQSRPLLSRRIEEAPESGSPG
jgi:hypothetical protein